MLLGRITGKLTVPFLERRPRVVRVVNATRVVFLRKVAHSWKSLPAPVDSGHAITQRRVG